MNDAPRSSVHPVGQGKGERSSRWGARRAGAWMAAIGLTAVLFTALPPALHATQTTRPTPTTQTSRPEAPPPGFGRYVMVLREPELEAPRPGPPPKIVVPEVAKLGGEILSSQRNKHEIVLPVGKVKRLRRDPNVAYVQRVWMGEGDARWLTERGQEEEGDGTEEEEDEANDARFRLAEEAETNLTWSSGTYQYDGSGNIKQVGSDVYQYDTAGRLIRAVIGGVEEKYKYDSFGNLKETSRTAVTRTIPVDPGSNRISGQVYDAAGNLTSSNGQQKYWYDSVGMVTHIGDRRAIYTADDERIALIIDGSITRWTIRDFEGRVIREFEGQGHDPLGVGGTWLWQQDYIHADGRLVGADREEFYGGRRHYHLDHLGSVRMVTTQARQLLSKHDYFPFGEEKTNPYYQHPTYGYQRPGIMRFAGHQRDFGVWDPGKTDYIDYMHARYYDPSMGRFLSVDPHMDLKKNLAAPQRWNRYSYVINNPLRYTDPDGRDLMIVYDFKDSDLTIRQQAAVMAGVRQRFINAGVKNVSSYIAGGTEPRAVTKTDQVTHIKVTQASIGKDRSGNETQGKTPWKSTAGIVSTRPAVSLPPTEFLNYVINVSAHEVGHASNRLRHHEADLGNPAHGSIMFQMSPQERAAYLREFDQKDRSVLQQELNEP